MNNFTAFEDRSDDFADNEAGSFSAPPPPLSAMAYSNPDVAKFAERVDSVFNRDSVETFWDCESEFRNLMKTDFVSQVFNNELRELAAEPGRLGDWRPGQLMVHRGRSFALAVASFDRPRRFIHTSPFFGMYAVLGAESLEYDIYKLPESYRNEEFNPAIKLECVGEGAITAGEVLQLRTDKYAYDFKVTSPRVVVKFTTAPFQTLEWLFNKDNLHAWQANDSELCSTQLRVAAYLLGRLAHQSSLDSLNLLTTHANHSVRWAAMQNLGRLSRTAALKKLEQALDDKHPHVRRAAAKSLQQIK